MQEFEEEDIHVSRKVPDILPAMEGANGIKYLVTDADNNLWDWVSMHAKSMHSMAEMLSLVTGLAYEDIRESMKRVYMAAGTFDFSKVVESMDIIQAFAKSKAEEVLLEDEKETEMVRSILQSSIVADLLSVARKQYDAKKNEVFRLYPGIEEVFRLVTENRIKIIILTDAPHRKTINRLHKFGLNGFVTKLFGQEQKPLSFKGDGENAPAQDYLKPFFEAIRASVPHLPNFSDLAHERSGSLRASFPAVTMGHDERKPYVNLARRLDISPEDVAKQVLVWGDNPAKDGGLATGIDVQTDTKAHQCEAKGYLYSGYGQVRNPDTVKLLSSFGSKNEINRNLSNGNTALDQLSSLQDQLIEQGKQHTRSRIISITHPLQVLDVLGIKRP